MTTPPTRVARRLVAPAIGLALGIAILSAPVSAQAGFTQYALNYPLHESTAKYSAVATVAGGKAFPLSILPRTYIQTTSGGVLVASAYANSGSVVYLSHAPYGGAKSRCYWDYVGGTIAGDPAIQMNCWRAS
jgi:hypothetical protein